MSSNLQMDNENFIAIHQNILLVYKGKWNVKVGGWNWKTNKQTNIVLPEVT